MSDGARGGDGAGAKDDAGAGDGEVLLAAIGGLVLPLLGALDALRFAARHLHPLHLAALAEAVAPAEPPLRECRRSEEHTSELQSLMRNSYAVFCLKQHTRNKRESHVSKTIM